MDSKAQCWIFIQTLTWVRSLNLPYKFTHKPSKGPQERLSRHLCLEWIAHIVSSAPVQNTIFSCRCERIHPEPFHVKHLSKTQSKAKRSNNAMSRNASRQPDSFSWLVMYLSISMWRCSQTRIQKQAKGTLSIFPFHQSLVVSHPTCFVPKREKRWKSFQNNQSNSSLKHRNHGSEIWICRIRKHSEANAIAFRDRSTSWPILWEAQKSCTTLNVIQPLSNSPTKLCHNWTLTQNASRTLNVWNNDWPSYIHQLNESWYFHYAFHVLLSKTISVVPTSHHMVYSMSSQYDAARKSGPSGSQRFSWFTNGRFSHDVVMILVLTALQQSSLGEG